jgi:hypothetical protein
MDAAGFQFLELIRLCAARTIGFRRIDHTVHGNASCAIDCVQLIQTCIDHDPRAQLRRSMVMMRQGWSMSLFQASQQWSKMLS